MIETSVLKELIWAHNRIPDQDIYGQQSDARKYEIFINTVYLYLIGPIFSVAVKTGLTL